MSAARSAILHAPAGSGPRTAARRFLLAFCVGWSVTATQAGAQLLPDPTAGTEADSPTAYSEESIGDVDPHGFSFRWMDPAQAGNLMKDRVLRSRAIGPDEAARQGWDPTAGSARNYIYRRPGVRATFHRPAYITWTLDGPRVNGAVSYEGGFREIIPPDTVFDLTPEPVRAADLTAFSAGMLRDGRVPLAVTREPLRGDASTVNPPSAEGSAPDVAPRRLQPWVRVQVDENGRARLEESADR